MANPLGRPSKYKPGMLPKIIALMSEGASQVEVAAMLDVSRVTINEWCDPKSPYYIEDFSYTIEKGVALSNAWWEREGRTSLRDKDFNANLYRINMNNRFGWSDRSETKHSGKVEFEPFKISRGDE